MEDEKAMHNIRALEAMKDVSAKVKKQRYQESNDTRGTHMEENKRLKDMSGKAKSGAEDRAVVEKVVPSSRDGKDDDRVTGSTSNRTMKCSVSNLKSSKESIPPMTSMKLSWEYTPFNIVLSRLSGAGEKIMQYLPGLFGDFQLPHFSCDQGQLKRIHSFSFTSIFPHGTVQPCHDPHQFMFLSDICCPAGVNYPVVLGHLSSELGTSETVGFESSSEYSSLVTFS